MEFKHPKDVTWRDIIVYTKDQEYMFTPTSIITAVFEGQIDLAPIPEHTCMVTGEEAIGLQTNTAQILLRPDIFQRLILTGLNPSEYRKLIKLFPDEHYLEDDFYTDTGKPIQSRFGYLNESLLYTPRSLFSSLAKEEPPNHGLDMF